ncbi:helix-turn-helix domain-containing protein [Alteribacillus sp. YIM 98480]|uniref:helix-turn-helix domain-containing protein n=1 Tax=Alteribacillus sp. YIM 98480 TaxID=2606599 RepID=UPI00131A7370|nr:helix-turn-helix domain-containing protein [Alteribacillus sp. YIM 98480]
MEILKSVQPILHKKLENTNYQIWIRIPKNKTQNLLYKKGEIPLSPPPFVPDLNKYEEGYKTYSDDNKLYLSFFYQEEYQVIICLFQQHSIFSTTDLDQFYLLFYLAFLQELIETKDKELNQLIDGIHSITSSLDVDKVLSNIIKNALMVFPNGDAAFLQLYDPAQDRLIPKASAGFNKSINFFKTKVGESITGKVFKEGSSKIYYSVDDIYKDMSNVSDENAFHIHRAVENRTAKALICVPVSIGDKQIGVMTIHLYKEGSLTADSAHLLQGFADQAAIAIRNAQLYTDLKKNLSEVTVLSEKLKEKNQVLLKGNETHKTLTRLSLQNKGIHPIVLELNRMMGTALYFVDVLENIYYPKRSSHFQPFKRETIAEIFSKKREPVYMSGGNGKDFYLYPIINRAVFLGCLVVLISKPLSRLEHVTIEQGASALALELVKKQTLTEIQYKKTHEFFNELLEHKDPESLTEKGKDFGIDLSSCLFVTVLELKNISDLELLEANIHQLVSSLKSQLTSFDYLVFGFHNKINLMAAMQRDTDMQKVTSIITNTVKEYNQRNSHHLSVGIGRLYKGMENINKSYDEANKALSYITKRKKRGIIHYEDIGVNRLFLDQSSEEMNRFVDEIFEPLKSNDLDLKKTLMVYMESNRNAKLSAEKLHIHINTLYQRLKKIEKRLNLDLNNPEDILKIQLACHLMNHF